MKYNEPDSNFKLELFRDLNPFEVIEFKKWARDNYTPGDEVKDFWHPVVRQECELINSES